MSMNSCKLVKSWFECWTSGNYRAIPVTEDFTHESPFGIINGKSNYLKLVESNEDKFLNHQFVFHDEIYQPNKACVRYSAIKDNFRLEVTEWYYFENELIKKIISHYNLTDDIRSEQNLSITS